MRHKALALDDELDWVHFMGALIYYARCAPGDLQRAHELLEYVPIVESAYPAFFWIHQYWLEQDFVKAHHKIQNLSEESLVLQHAYMPKSLLLGLSHDFMGKPALAAKEYQLAIEHQHPKLVVSPDDFRFHLAQGTAYAALKTKKRRSQPHDERLIWFPWKKMLSKSSQIHGLFFTAEPLFKVLWAHPRFVDLINKKSTDGARLKG